MGCAARKDGWPTKKNPKKTSTPVCFQSDSSANSYEETFLTFPASH